MNILKSIIKKNNILAKLFTSLLLLIIIGGFSIPAGAETVPGKLALGLNYPGLSLKYSLTDKYSAELKVQYEKDIMVTGIRAYRYFDALGKITPFFVFEADYISFTGESAKGTGFAAGAMFGGEYFSSDNIGIQLDFGPALITLSDNDYNLSVSGIEYVINFGINYYFK